MVQRSSLLQIPTGLAPESVLLEGSHRQPPPHPNSTHPSCVGSGLMVKRQMCFASPPNSCEQPFLPAGGVGNEEVKAMYRLLRELDVADDETASKTMQTRDCYRETYGLEPGPLQLTS